MIHVKAALAKMVANAILVLMDVIIIASVPIYMMAKIVNGIMIMLVIKKF
jgi:hypothetical protein